jgi:hypothetical protein
MLSVRAKWLLLVGLGLTGLTWILLAGTFLWCINRGIDPAVGEIMKGGVVPALVLMDFSASLQVGSIEGAYAVTSDAYQRQHSLEAFRKFVSNHAELRAEWKEINLLEQKADLLIYEITTLSPQNEQSKFRIELRRADSSWRIAELHIPEKQ